MSSRKYYILKGYGPDERFLSASEKEELQDLVYDGEMFDDFENLCSDAATVMEFWSEYSGATTWLYGALLSYTRMNPGMLLELTVDCDDENYHIKVRFRGGVSEPHFRTELYPEFTRIILNREKVPLPVIEFSFEAAGSRPAESIRVLLDDHISEGGWNDLCEHIASESENIKAEQNREQAIHRLLDEAGLAHWILKPEKRLIF